MDHLQKCLSPTARNRAYRRAFEKLDEALEKNDPWDNSAKIAAMRRAYFADVDAAEPVVLPKLNLAKSNQ